MQSMSPRCDVVIAGLGAMGSAIAYHLAQRGRSVIGFDRFRPPHAHGSSHGDSRIIREAYFEHPVYVPMVQRAYELWDALAREFGQVLYQRTGGLMLGDPDTELIEGALQSARAHGLAHELIDAGEVHRRFAALAPSSDMVGVLEPRAGVLFPERCVAAHLTLAREAGAELRFDEPIEGWETDGDGDGGGVRVFTHRGEVRARTLIAASGAWIGQLLPDLATHFTIERQTLYWFDPVAGASQLFDPARCPVHLWQFDGPHFFYGFPDLGGGVKVGRHHDGVMTSVEAIDRTIGADEVEDIRALVRRFVPAAGGALRNSNVCTYTNTRDQHFWIDRHPAHPQVMIVSACSGHGFKFSSVVGEIVADSIVEGRSRFDLKLFGSRGPASPA